MNATQLLTRTAAGSLLGLATAGIALSATPAQATPTISSTVTIQADHTDLSGTVSSPNASCESDRSVIVYKVVGTRGGGDDLRFAMDTSDDDGSWNTGNTGTPGKFYAKVKKTTFCKADFSPTVTARR